MYTQLSKNITWEVSVLVLLMGVSFEVHRWDGLRWQDIHAEFHEDWFGHSGNTPRQSERL
jgi:hypothetical protein